MSRRCWSDAPLLCSCGYTYQQLWSQVGKAPWAGAGGTQTAAAVRQARMAPNPTWPTLYLCLLHVWFLSGETFIVSSASSTDPGRQSAVR
jgi:type VI protein secretion system component VasF